MFDWNRVRLVAMREIRIAVQRKSFRISTIIQILIVAALALAPILIVRFTSDDEPSAPESTSVVVADQAQAGLADTLPTVLAAVGVDPGTMKIATAPDADAAAGLVKDGKADLAVVSLRNDAGLLDFRLVTSDGGNTDTSQTISAALQAIGMQDNVARAGLTPQEAQAIFAQPDLATTNVANDAPEEDTQSDDMAFRYILAYIGSIAIFMAVVLYGSWIANGVVEEKANRIMEIMINAATPRDLLAGKVIGVLTSAMLQFLPTVLVGCLILGFQKQIAPFFGVDPEKLFNVNFGVLASTTVVWFVVFFVLGLVLYGSVYAGIGSSVSRQEEVATALSPMAMVMMLGYFAAIYTLSNPESIISTVAYFFPGTTAIVGVPYVLLSKPAMWQSVVGVVILIIAVGAAMWFAGRIYRVGVLMYGQSPGIKAWWTLLRREGVARH